MPDVYETAVVYHFGAVARRLGYSALRIQPHFPDARLTRFDGREIRAEFEFRASNFRRHRHPAHECDLIICWEDDWKGSPIPVLELSSICGVGWTAAAAWDRPPAPPAEVPAGRVCLVCLDSFTPKRSDNVYCSNACKSKAARARAK